MIGFFLWEPVLLKYNDSPLRRLKRWRKWGYERRGEKEETLLLCRFLICTKFRFALHFLRPKCCWKYYSLITTTLNLLANAFVEVLTGGFSPQKETFGGFPSHAICATMQIKSTWNFHVSRPVCFCVFRVHVNLFGGVVGGFSLSFPLIHTCMQKYACTKNTHSCRIFHLCREARPPLAFLTRNHVQICTGRQREGERVMWTCVGVSLSLSVSLSLLLLLSISSAWDPDHLLMHLKHKA